jgi:serine phosphatase RsbU (regulator of sigma subunit)
MTAEQTTDTRTATVFIVDDEEVVTQTIRSFLQLETDFDVRTFNSGPAALEGMGETRADVVVSDFLMPGMNGIEFLSEVRKRYPACARVLLTGYADKENAIRAINEADIFQYLEKPWDNDQLVLVIKNALREKRLDSRLAEKISELDHALLEKDRIAQEHDALREELALARRVQKAMLPELDRHGAFDFSASWLPALAVGGDFYDIVRLSDSRLAAIVADATGHGIQAALSTTLLKAAFGEVARQTSSPRDMLLSMNDIIFRVLPTDLFVAAIVATISPGEGELTVVGGGGPHPFLLRSSGGGVEPLVANGLPLGVVESQDYPDVDEVTCRLEDGDRVVVFTDGITEVQNSDGVEFGEKGLTPALRELAAGTSDLPDLLDSLVSRARSFARDDHPWDDVTLLGIARRAG